MVLLNKDIFICIDCETTGLDEKNDRIIEIAVAKFSFNEIIHSYETLIDPEIEIPKLSQAIHNISQEMVQNKPKIKDILPEVLKMINGHIIVGHGIYFDISMIANEAQRNIIPCSILDVKYIDTLRLARLYGNSPINSLERLREHFNIEQESAHRAMSDVKVNIEVFKQLSKDFTTTHQLLERLKKPILLKNMPLGKHKGRSFSEIPIEYLLWAANKDFDQDLLYSIRSEINNRKKGNNFEQAINPFQSL